MLVLRNSASLDVVASLSRERVRAIDPGVRVIRVAPFTHLLDGPFARPRFNAGLVGIFALAALFLAAVGLYAVVAASVRRRHREIGIRVALGATAAQVRSLVLGEAMRLAVSGAVAGLATALVTTRLIRARLFEGDPLDPATLLAAPAVLVAVSLMAAYLPMRRATRVDPAAMLRDH